MKKLLSFILIFLVVASGGFALSGCNKKQKFVTTAINNGVEYKFYESVVTNYYRFNARHENYYTVVARFTLTNKNNTSFVSNSGEFRIKSHSKYILNGEGVFKGMPEFIDTTPSSGTISPGSSVKFSMTMNLMPLTQVGEGLNPEAQKKFLQDCNRKLEATTFTLYLNDEKLIDFKVDVK